MFYINKYLLIYGYTVTVLLFILVAYPEQCLYGLMCLQFSQYNLSLGSDIDVLNLCINNFDIPRSDSMSSDNAYIRFANILRNSKRIYTVSLDNSLKIKHRDYLYQVSCKSTTFENTGPMINSTILKVLDLKLKLEQECKLKLEKNYRLKLEEYDIHLAKWLEEGLNEICKG